jgi:thiol-disulfide isomerase/thioredoxin
MTAPLALIVACALLASDGPLVFEVPAEGPSLSAQRTPVFFAAPFEVRDGQLRRGAWTSSDEILGEGWTRVIVVASWCPACKELLQRLSAERPRRTVILLLEDENETRLERAVRRGKLTSERGPLGRGAQPERRLADAAVLEGYPLPLHLLRSDSALARQVTHYPFMFSCSRTRCTPERARRELPVAPRPAR